MAAAPTTSAARQTWVSARLEAAPGPVLLVVTALGYLALAQLVMVVNDPVSNGASLWPPAGLTLAVLLLVPTRSWGWVLGGVVLAELSGDLAWGYGLDVSLGFTLGNTLGPLVGAVLLRRAGNPRGELSPARPLLLFLLFAVVVGPTVGATFGALAAELSAPGSFAGEWARWLVGDGLGVLVVAPLLLAGPSAGVRRSVGERVALVLGSAVTTVVVFSNLGGDWQATLPYLIVPFLIWTSLRFGTRATALMALGVTLVADAATTWGLGPFAVVTASPTLSTLLLQMFLVSTVASALLLAAVTHDLRDRRQTEALLRRQATHDPLTGLPNRLLLGERLTHATPAASDGLLVCDLDGLKGVNDRYGHREGDRLLVEVARRLRDGVRPDDLVARISGDEFVVLLTGIDEDSLMRVARRILDTVRRPTVLGDGREVVPSVSVGAARRQPGETSESLFRQADAALYESKRRGRGTVVLADEGLRRRAEQDRQLQDELTAAVEGDGLVTYFRPLVDLATGRVVAAEATLRRRHAEHGPLETEPLRSAAEAAGLADLLLEHSLEDALRAHERWHRRCGRRVPVAVNVSAPQLAGGGVANAVRRALAATDAPASSLRLEVTQTTPLDDLSVACLHQLHALGVRVALDSFGSGYESVSQLARIPWDLLKIDRSLTDQLDAGSPPPDAVRALVAAAAAVGIPLGADGVTRIGQVAALRQLGCGSGQGPMFGRAMSAEDMATLLAADRRPGLPATPLPAPAEL